MAAAFAATVGAVTLRAVPAKAASDAPGPTTPATKRRGRLVARRHPVYRRGTFAEGRTFTTGNATLTVVDRRRVVGPDGKRLADPHAFEAVLRQIKGKALGSNTYALTDEKGNTFDLYISSIGRDRFSAVINRYRESAS